LNDQFNEFDQTVRTLSDWVQEQTSDLDFMRSRSMEAGVKDNLRKCDVKKIFFSILINFFSLNRKLNIN
jgi:hypothetical protein